MGVSNHMNLLLFFTYLGTASHRSSSNGSWLSCALVTFEQIMQRYRHCNLHYIYVYQFVFIFYHYFVDIWPHVPIVRRFWHKRYWVGCDGHVQYNVIILYMWWSSLCISSCSNQFSKKTANGGAKLDELGRPNWDKYVFASYWDEPFEY